MTGLVATASTEIEASPERVWQALTDPDQIKAYMFGSEVITDWRQGSPIVWKGEYDGRAYEDRGEILDIEPTSRLTVTHFSPLSGEEDVPANYHRLTYLLEEDGDRTRVTLSQDNNPTEEAAEHAARNWEMMLAGLKKVAEHG